jgi:hypothetical protein
MTQFTCKGVKQINNWISLNMTFTFTIHISWRFSSVREFQMGNFQKYWSQNVGQDFIVLDFFHGRKILKVDGRDEGTFKIGRKMLPPEGSHVWISNDNYRNTMFPTLIRKLHILHELFPFNAGKMVHFYFNENNIYFFP